MKGYIYLYLYIFRVIYCVGTITEYDGNKATHLIVTQSNTLDCNNISTITLVFIKLFSKAKNRNVYFKI